MNLNEAVSLTQGDLQGYQVAKKKSKGDIFIHQAVISTCLLQQLMELSDKGYTLANGKQSLHQ